MNMEHYYYKLTGVQRDGTEALFHLALLPDCEVYRGHFPGHPVCPGVCTMQAVKECAERLTGQHLRIRTLRRCRLTALATPATCPQLTVRMVLHPTAGGYDMVATVSDAGRTCMECKGELAVAGMTPSGEKGGEG